MRFAPAAWALFALLSGCRPSAVEPSRPADFEDAALGRLLTTMNERLALMEDVAKFKRAQAQPINDPAREAQMLEQLEAKAPAHGLAAKDVRRFFTAQISAARAVQENLFARWDRESATVSKDSIDLAKVRERINQINDQLLVALAEWRHQSDPDAVRRKAAEGLNGNGVTDHVRELAIEPLLSAEK
jgi:chorismate mutase